MFFPGLDENAVAAVHQGLFVVDDDAGGSMHDDPMLASMVVHLIAE